MTVLTFDRIPELEKICQGNAIHHLYPVPKRSFLEAVKTFPDSIPQWHVASEGSAEPLPIPLVMTRMTWSKDKASKVAPAQAATGKNMINDDNVEASTNPPEDPL